MASFIYELDKGLAPDSEDNVFQDIWNEYERVIIHSLITSFGLDFLVQDQHGGDVDTIHNVREVGKDPDMVYKNAANQAAYENRETYDRVAYHSDPRYTSIVRKARKEFDEHGTMIDDAYVEGNKVIPRNNNTIPRGQQGQLDHVVSASEIHNDPGRILAGLDGKELANSEGNLRYTNAALNLNMSDMSMEEYIAWCEANPDKVNWNGNKGEPLSEEVKSRLRKEYSRAKKEYDAKLAKAYYTSPKFYKDMAAAVGKRGVEMGLRQAFGFVFVEIWMASKQELQTVPPNSELQDMVNAVGRGVEKGVENAKSKYKEIFAQFGAGFVSGSLASLTTTLCNIFFTTAKNLVRNIRQIYAAVVQAGRTLLFNPDDLMLGDRIKAATVILATGASVLAGTAVGELIAATPAGMIPGVGPHIVSFCSALVSGLLSCTLLICLDRSRLINSIIDGLNAIPTEVNNYREIADAMEVLATKLEDLDLAKFRADTERYQVIAQKIGCAESEDELNGLLLSAYDVLGIEKPWEGHFDSFMGNKSNKLVFG